MAMSLARAAASTSAGAARPRVSVARPAGVRPTLRAQPKIAQRGVSVKVGVEIAQVADEISFIAGTAVTMGAMTLVGLAVGFVLLRVETLAEADN